MPAGWLTMDEACRRLGYDDRRGGSKAVYGAVALGLVEKRFFRRLCPDGRAHPIPHFRVVKKAILDAGRRRVKDAEGP